MHARPVLAPGRSSASESSPAPDEAGPARTAGKRTLTDALAPHEPEPERDEASQTRAATARAVASPATALPFRDLIQRAFGRHDVSSVRAHVGDQASAAARELGVHAFATGDHVVFDGAPDLHTAAHETAHVIQQRAGVQLPGGVGRPGDEHERHADEVAAAVVAGGSVEALLDRHGGGGRPAVAAVQHMKRRLVVNPEPDRVTLLVQATWPRRNQLVVEALVDRGLSDLEVVTAYALALQLYQHAKGGSSVRAAVLATHGKLAPGDAIALLGSVKVASSAELIALLNRGKVVSGAELRAVLASPKVDSAANLATLLDAPIAPNTTALVAFFTDPHVPSLREVLRAVADDGITDWTAHWARRRNVTDTDAHDQGYDALLGGTLDALYRHGEAQVDWHRGLVNEDQRGPIRLMLEILRNVPGALAGCGSWNAGELWEAVHEGPVIGDARRAQLLAYARGVEGEATCPVPVKDTVERGLSVGREVLEIEAELGLPLAHAIFTADAFQELRDDDLVGDFLHYVHEVHPTLSAREGKEVESYVALREAVDPMATLRAALTDWVVNLHRFEAAALVALAEAVGDHSGARPVTVLVHSPLDRDGAFHRDANLTAVIRRDGHRTLMIEGHGDLAGVAARIEHVRTTYCGDARRIANVMIVGHGQSRSVSIAGTTDAEGKEHDVDLDIDEAGGRDFLRTLINGMVDGGDSRLVFNACHTDSTDLENTEDLSDDGDAERDAERLRAYLTAHPSLSAFARSYARDRGQALAVHGANAATRSGMTFLDGGGQLTLRSDGPRGDREIAGTKLAYVEHGTDPKGVMRAVLEVWAERGDALAPLRAAMERRVHVASTVLNELIIQTAFRLVLGPYWERARDIVRLIEAVSCLKKLRYEEDCTVAKLADADLTGDEFAALDVAAAGSTEWGEHFLPIVFGQRAGRPAAVVTALGLLRREVRQLTRRDRMYIASTFDFAGQLPLLAPAPATRGQVLLAIIGFKQHANLACRQFLDAYFAAVTTELPWTGDFGLNRASLMRDLGPPVGPAPRDGNVRVGGARNTARLEPLTCTGRIRADTRAHTEPDVTTGHVALLQDANVRVIGRLPGWIAIEAGATTRFVLDGAVELP